MTKLKFYVYVLFVEKNRLFNHNEITIYYNRHRIINFPL